MFLLLVGVVVDTASTVVCVTVTTTGVVMCYIIGDVVVVVGV